VRRPVLPDCGRAIYGVPSNPSAKIVSSLGVPVV
jgi:hypothetical protein